MIVFLQKGHLVKLAAFKQEFVTIAELRAAIPATS